MPSRVRRVDDAAVRAALVEQWERLLPAVARVDPSAPTRLPGWDAAELAGHLTGTVRRLADALDRPAPPRPSLALVDYYPAPVAWPELDAGDPPPGLDAAVASARAALAAAPAGRLVRVSAGDLRLTDYLLTRVVEAVVHGLDLPDPVEPAPAAARLVAQLLADTLAARNPGRTLELRVPPYAAVQCLPGPAHTRGTPPNVVEADPLTWIEVAAGRVGWAELVAAGRIRASGARADLSPYLPVL